MCRTRGSFLPRRGHAVSDAALVEDPGGVGRILAELAAQRPDEDAHQVRVGVVALLPDPAQQRLVGKTGGVRIETAGWR